MRAPTSHRHFLIGFFLLTIYVVPLSQTAAELLRGARPGFVEVFSEKPTAANLRSFEREIERSSVVAHAVRPWTQYFWFAALGNGGDKTVMGLDGWLFYKPDLRYLLETGDADGPVPVIVRFRDELASRGIHLLVAPVPGKPGVYPDRLTRRRLDTNLSPTRGLVASLREHGIETLDLFGQFASCGEADPCYLERDTHWTGATARRAAEAAAERIRALGWVSGGATPYTVRPVVVPRTGDLVRMMNSPALERSAPPEQVRCEQVVRADTGELDRDAPDSRVLVLGDSFLRIYQTDAPRAAGFVAHLARALGQPVASIINDGGASTLVRQQLARAPKLLAGKNVVVWEFVERDVRFGTEGWQDVPLP
ncbi:MAG TPA: hypothetical protein VF767_00315 [Bryobacteraceae bacterium]